MKYCLTHAYYGCRLPAFPNNDTTETECTLMQAGQRHPLVGTSEGHTGLTYACLTKVRYFSTRYRALRYNDFLICCVFGKCKETCVTFLITSCFFLFVCLFPTSCHNKRNGCDCGSVDLISFHSQFVVCLLFFFQIFVSLHISADIVSFKKKKANNLYTKCAIIL